MPSWTNILKDIRCTKYALPNTYIHTYTLIHTYKYPHIQYIKTFTQLTTLTCIYTYPYTLIPLSIDIYICIYTPKFLHILVQLTSIHISTHTHPITCHDMHAHLHKKHYIYLHKNTRKAKVSTLTLLHHYFPHTKHVS